MGLKDLFIKSEDSDEGVTKVTKPINTPSSTKFPSTEKHDSGSSFNIFGGFSSQEKKQTIPTNTLVSDETLKKMVEAYENGFNGLNQPGYDFYEFYQMIKQGGIDNPQAYTMALSMASVMDKSVTKEKLIEQASYYLSEIEKFYNDNVIKGNNKKEQIIGEKSNEKQSLINELENLKAQQEAIGIQIRYKETKLAAIGSKYDNTLNDIDSKLAANEKAKSMISNSIESVVSGIKNNL